LAIEFKYHYTAGGIKIAEILPGGELISDPDDILDLMAINYNNRR